MRKSQENNRSVIKKLLRKWFSCAFCPPNQGENSSRKPKHGVKKPKYKNKR